MENYIIEITSEHQHHFQVTEHPHHQTGGCKYKIFQNQTFVASLEPDGQHFLHVCTNPAGVDLEILHLLAEQIQAHHPHPRHLNEPEI